MENSRTKRLRKRNEVRICGTILKSLYPRSIIVSNKLYQTATIKVSERNGREKYLPILLQNADEFDGRRVFISGQMYRYYIEVNYNEEAHYQSYVCICVDQIIEGLQEDLNYVIVRGIIKFKPFYKRALLGLGNDISELSIEVPGPDGMYTNIPCIAYGNLARKIGQIRQDTLITFIGKVQGGKEHTKILISSIEY